MSPIRKGSRATFPTPRSKKNAALTTSGCPKVSSKNSEFNRTIGIGIGIEIERCPEKAKIDSDRNPDSDTDVLELKRCATTPRLT